MNQRITAVCALAAFLAAGAVFAAVERPFTEEFPLGECQFQTQGENRYFILKPGRELHFDNSRCVERDQCEELEVLVITVLHETYDVTLKIDGVWTTIRTRVVEERETVDGQLVEESRNFFAECAGTEDMYYFGEKVNIYHADGSVTHEGEWEAGKNGARPGMIFPGGAYLLGARYFQEVAPPVALDRAEHVGMGLEIDVPAGSFDDCVEVAETTPLNRRELSIKMYCPDTGLVIDGDAELVSVVE